MGLYEGAQEVLALSGGAVYLYLVLKVASPPSQMDVLPRENLASRLFRMAHECINCGRLLAGMANRPTA